MQSVSARNRNSNTITAVVNYNIIIRRAVLAQVGSDAKKLSSHVYSSSLNIDKTEPTQVPHTTVLSAAENKRSSLAT